MKYILIVDDHEVVRNGVKKILGDEFDPVTFGEAASVANALCVVLEQDWDIGVFDLSLGDRGGLELLKEVKRIRPSLGVLILSLHSEEQYARRAFKAGAAGYITKDSPAAELVNAVKKVMSGGRYVSPALAERLAIDLGSETNGALHENLSDREFEVMCLIASGKTVGQIAELLQLSDKTISTYRTRILEKTGMSTSSEITHYALQNKLVD